METAPRPRTASGPAPSRRSASVRTASTIPAPRPAASARTVPPPLPRLLPPELCRAYGRPWHSYGTDALLTRWSLLRTDPGTKIIQTAVLAALCAAVLWKDRALFLARPAPREARHHEPTTTQH